ncbi:MAG: GIY-YIG nuclease family protein [Blastocatellia bacterium]|nr:GIY-YIG nuclease family protein [Blastocatellia bacterium]
MKIDADKIQGYLDRGGYKIEGLYLPSPELVFLYQDCEIIPSIKDNFFFVKIGLHGGITEYQTRPVSKDYVLLVLSVMEFPINEARYKTGKHAKVEKAWFIPDKSSSEPKSTTRHGVIYFIQGNDGGLIKIGYTDDVDARFKDMQRGCPIPLKVIGAFPGTMQDEKECHRQFAHLRSYGEWFYPSSELIAFINFTLSEGGLSKDDKRYA